ncbi:MAG: hypothetical protein WC080_00125 [Patescibacteria group bacterium]|jgi:hypothetical protein
MIPERPLSVKINMAIDEFIKESPWCNRSLVSKIRAQLQASRFVMPERLCDISELSDLITTLYEILDLDGDGEFRRVLDLELSLEDGNSFFYETSKDVGPQTPGDMLFQALVENLELDQES